MAKNFDKDGTFKATVSTEVEIKLVESDIFNWLNACENPEILRYLGNAALRFAKALENPDEDDFRSRA